MMDKNNYIIDQSEDYLKIQGKSLEERLEEINISQDQENEILSNKTIKTIRDTVLGSFKVGEVISTILNWNEEIDQEINEAKKAVLLDRYLALVDRQQDSINNLKVFLSNPQGNVIFNKILRILDDNPPDYELIGHLASALKFIIDDKSFCKLFESHRFALAQIEKLSVQALTILADYKNYPSFNLSAVSIMGQKVSSEWNIQFTQVYCNKKSITSDELSKRVLHVIIQLQSQGYIEAYKSRNGGYECRVTDVGKDLLPYLSK